MKVREPLSTHHGLAMSERAQDLAFARLTALPGEISPMLEGVLNYPRLARFIRCLRVHVATDRHDVRAPVEIAAIVREEAVQKLRRGAIVGRLPRHSRTKRNVEAP